MSKVGSMQYMFYYARQFNSDISGWDVSNVQGTGYMFSYAEAFSQDITGWSVYDSDYEPIFIYSHASISP